ncbi:PLP-dependent aminotransferase family protein [Microbacterium azadirachtae]|uniref:aminotransferase-like domain-containing protein n=1 Tax=Microbacterium azadirachtae TaxID=582680 RepID=UPI00069910AA|nr:PLP-dependent aminotransferase family protein [Microbacterium azadirachtae]
MTTDFDAADLTRMLGDWSHPGAPVSKQLAVGLSELIASSALPTGTRLPSQRDLAQILGLARGTVGQAYDQLALDGYIDLQPGSRARVRGGAAVLKTTARLRSFSDRADVLDLSSGSLPGLPAVAAAYTSLTAADIEPLVAGDGYDPMGILPLRQAIADDLSARGTPTSPDDLLITSGSQQAVWLCAQLLVTAGDVALLEEPSYRGAIEALGNMGARLIGVPVRQDGVDTEILLHHIERMRPRLVYLQPTAHNPTGATLPIEKRRALARALAAHEVTVVEDLSSADLLFDSSPPPTLATVVGSAARVLTIGTASKLWWGGMRVGWIRGEPAVLRRLSEIRKAVDLAGAPVDQLVAARLTAHAEAARAERRRELRTGRDLLLSALHERLPSWSYVTPSGGTGLWIDTGIDSLGLAEAARKVGVRIVAGPAFSVTGGMRTHIRLPFGQSSQVTHAATALLADAFRAVRSRGAAGQAR